MFGWVGRGVCTQAPCYCIVMEYCPNGQLYEFLRTSCTLSPSLLLNWAQQIAAGMSYVHSHKIIHRDLKSPKLAFAIITDVYEEVELPLWKQFLAEIELSFSFSIICFYLCVQHTWCLIITSADVDCFSEKVSHRLICNKHSLCIHDIDFLLFVVKFKIQEVYWLFTLTWMANMFN